MTTNGKKVNSMKTHNGKEASRLTRILKNFNVCTIIYLNYGIIEDDFVIFDT